jgi:hypothetical protein
LCAAQDKDDRRAQSENPRITRAGAPFAPYGTGASRRRIGQSKGIMVEKLGEGRDQYKRKIHIFTGFSAFLYPHEDE